MILIIDTTQKECSVGIADGEKLDEIKWQWENDTGTEVLENIEKLLKKRQKNLKDIKAILVNRGPGSFTGTRVGITVANTLAWSLNIPIYGYRKEDFEKAIKKISKNNQSHFSKIVLPYYL